MTLTHDGQRMQTTATPADIVAFERAFGLGFGKAFGKLEDIRLEHQLWLAWASLKRQRRIDVDFETWMPGVEKIGEEAETTAPLAGTDDQPTG